MSVWRRCVLAPWRPGARFMCGIRTDIDKGGKLSWLPTGSFSVHPTFSDAGILYVPTLCSLDPTQTVLILDEVCEKSTERFNERKTSRTLV